ncbi:hypothetical protein WJX74_007339 [Apatococcus lobatus]|uniref:N-acetyltransferase domain-containing protein n=1 Tax=Apatococcus lobatus TaxID=904363 RepID=A0AAW1QW93_9CHLO
MLLHTFSKVSATLRVVNPRTPVRFTRCIACQRRVAPSRRQKASAHVGCIGLESSQECSYAEGCLPEGRCTIHRMEREDLAAAATLLMRCFGFKGKLKLSDIEEFLEQLMDDHDDIAFLVTRLTNPHDESLLARGRRARVIGIAVIDFHGSSRQFLYSLQPPDNDPYISNMAVDPRFRRRGVALGLLVAAARLCEASGYERMFLHIQAGDSAAEALYLKAGFQICKMEPRSLVQRLQNTEPRKLLMQPLAIEM